MLARTGEAGAAGIRAAGIEPRRAHRRTRPGAPTKKKVPKGSVHIFIPGYQNPDTRGLILALGKTNTATLLTPLG